MKPHVRHRLAALASFTLTLAAIFAFVERAPRIETERAEPVLAADGEIAPLARQTLEVPQRIEITTPAAVASAAEFDRERFASALDAARHASEQNRKRWLSGKSEFMSSDLIDELLAAGDGPEGVTFAIEALRTEGDPLLQAMLLQYLGLREDDPRVLAPLELAARGLLGDRTRPVAAELAVDGLLAAMGRQRHPVGALVREIAAATQDPIILRDLFFGLTRHGFDFAENREVLMEGLAHADSFARFGASESLRMFALDGALTPDEFVAAFAPSVLAEKDPQNQLLFLETLGAVGKSAALPTLRALANDPNAEPRVRNLAATSLAAHADPQESMAFCGALFTDRSDPTNVKRAISALGVVAAPQASEALAEIFEKSSDPATRRLALRSLQWKSGASVDTFLAAAKSDDVELRMLAAEQFMAMDPATLSVEQQAEIHDWQHDRAVNDADPQVRSSAVVGAFLRDDAASAAIVEERLRNDSDPEVRGTAASLLYAKSWAEQDAEGCARVRALIDNENPLVRSRIGLALEQLDSMTPADARKQFANEKRLAEIIGQACPTTLGSKDVFGMQQRMLEKMLAKLGN